MIMSLRRVSSSRAWDLSQLFCRRQQQQWLASSRWASTLVISEPLDEDGSTPAGTRSTVTAATKLNNGNVINLLVVGGTVPTKVPEGVSKVFHVPIDDKLSETVTNAVVDVIDDDCNVVMGTASKFGSTVVPRTAAVLDVSPVTDILVIEDEKTFIRPMYAGNALAKVVADPGPNGNERKVMSIRPTCFDKADLVEPTAVETIDTVNPFDKAKWIGESVSKSDRPDLSSASIVVSGGRGIKSGDNFPILEALADKLGAAVGASRAAVDAGFCPNDWYTFLHVYINTRIKPQFRLLNPCSSCFGSV